MCCNNLVWEKQASTIMFVVGLIPEREIVVLFTGALGFTPTCLYLACLDIASDAKVIVRDFPSTDTPCYDS
eukprot:10887543-Heterocapsa_arctica.AAC.1